MSDAVRYLEDYDTEQRYDATVVQSERLTPESSAEEVRELLLDVNCPEDCFRVGHCIGVLAPGTPEFGNEYHLRLYTVADVPERGAQGRLRVPIAVRRCTYVDEYSGERHPGVASNYLCDLRSGDSLLVTGPFDLPFQVPEDPDVNLIMIGSGTGIAPFRALVKQIHRDTPDWKGRIWLFCGARTGLEMLYMNDEQNDLAQYFDQQTFEAIEALSPEPARDAPIAWESAMEGRSEELWELLGDPRTYVYVAGLEKLLDELDAVFAKLAGAGSRWDRRKAELMAGGRWVELVY
jgi:ferredoxin--NADP+ reductase